MKKITAILLCCTMLLMLCPVSIAKASAEGATYYVSPDGDDSNSGLTKEEAWATLYKAAQTLTAGDTAVFMDGTYNETEYTSFINEGTSLAPITLKSENKHGAKIVYGGDLRNQKLRVDKSYINIRDFEITQERASTDADEKPTLDILLNCGDSEGLTDSSYIIEGCEITGNKFYNVYEEGIKVKYARDILIEDNLILNPTHEGMDIFGCSDVTISGNEVDDAGRVGIMVKGNSRNCKIYNNYVHNEDVEATAYHVGGHSDKRSCYVTAQDEGFEAYNLVFCNNIAYSTQGKQKHGFYFSGAKDCRAYNNLIKGAKYAFRLGDNGGLNMGGAEKPEAHWEWDAKTVNPVLRNNIIVDVENAFLIAEDMAVGTDSDYNLFSNVTSNTREAVEVNSITTTETLFADEQNNDWHLSAASPARKKGEALPSTVDAYDGITGIDTIDTGKEISIEHIDYANEVRKTPWDIGIYNRGKTVTTELLSEGFETGTAGANIEGGVWNSWKDKVGGQTQKDTDITIEQENISGGKTNKYVQIKRTRISDTNSALHYMYKGFSNNVKEGIVNYEFKLRQNDAGANKFILYILKGAGSINVDSLNSGKASEYTFAFSDGKLSGGGLGSSCYFASGGATEDKWYNFEFVCDLDNAKLHVFCDGTRLTAQSGAALGIETDGIYGFAMGTNRNGGATAENVSFHIDDVYASYVGDLDVKIEPSQDGNLQTAEVYFTNNLTGITTGNIKVNNGDIGVTSITPINGSRKHYLLTFDSALTLETEYDVKFTSLTDMYGGALAEKTISYKTRDRQKNIGEIKFYKDFGTVNEAVMNTLENTTVTAAFEVVNETLDGYNAVLVGVHKRDGKVLSAEAADASVPKETTARKSLPITVSSVTAGDSIEVYLWDSVQGMKPIGDAKIITASGVETMPLEENTVTSLTLNASISGASADSGTMTLSGNAVPAGSGAVTAYVLKPGFTLSSLNVTNFSDRVDFVGQKSAAADGSYSFSYTMQNAVNNTIYTAYAGGKSITEQKDYSITFFGEDFIDSVVAAFNSASATQITQMLAGSIYVPGVTPSVYLNTVLNLDLDVYNTLNDYTATENYKTAVAKALETITFTDTEHIRTEFNTIVSAQKTNQENYITLLAKINDALWGDLAQLFSNNDSILQLNWSGSYSKISSDSALLEQLYKKLANGYTFTDFDMLRSTFESEAKALIPPVQGSDGGNEGSGGGKKFSYDDALKNTDDLTPIITDETENNDNKAEFDDIDGVLWAKDAIIALAEEGIISGMGNNKFAPDEKVTREQFIKMIVLACGLYDENAQNEKFVDVTANSWYEKYVASAVDAGIIFGIDSDHFGVGEEITRAEMAAILYRVCLCKEIVLKTDGDNSEYADSYDIPEYAYESIMALKKAGIMSGVGDDRFAANEESTRAMAAKVIWLLKGEV